MTSNSEPASASKSIEDHFLSFDNVPTVDQKTTESRLSWRLDPEESYSDWTIIIKKESNTNLTNMYHVHKAVLSLGPNKSDYFASAFRSTGAFQESASSTSEISLPDLAFDVFEYMLDFIYDPTSADREYWNEVDVSIENLVALRYLSQYFSVRSLFATVSRQFLLDTKEVIALLMAAESLQDEPLIDLFVDRFVLSCHKIEIEQLSPGLALRFFQSDKHVDLEQAADDDVPVVEEDVVQEEVQEDAGQDEDANGAEKDPLVLSCVLAKYCWHHRDDIDCDFLLKAVKHIQVVHVDVSPFLLSLALELEDRETGSELEPFKVLCRNAYKTDVQHVAEALFDRDVHGVNGGASKEYSTSPAHDSFAGNFQLLEDSAKAGLLGEIFSSVWVAHKSETNRYLAMINRMGDQLSATKKECSNVKAFNSKLMKERDRLQGAISTLKERNCLLSERIIRMEMDEQAAESDPVSPLPPSE